MPYRGAAQALTDIVAGHVDMMFDTIVTSLPLHRAGTAKIIGVGSEQRARALPNVPAIAETLPGFRSRSWFAAAAPPGTPAALVDKISRDIAELLKENDVAAKLREFAARSSRQHARGKRRSSWPVRLNSGAR